MKSYFLILGGIICAVIIAMLLCGAAAYSREFYVQVVGLKYTEGGNVRQYGHVYAVRLDRGMGPDRTWSLFEDFSSAQKTCDTLNEE